MKKSQKQQKNQSHLLSKAAFAVSLEITCEGATGTAQITNEEPSAKVHRVKWSKSTLQVENCKGSKPAKCTQPAEPMTAEATGEAVEGLVGPKGEENAMGMNSKDRKQKKAS